MSSTESTSETDQRVEPSVGWGAGGDDESTPNNPVLVRSVCAFPKQHKVVDASAEELEARCGAQERHDQKLSVEEFDPRKQTCQHQDCFGGGPKSVTGPAADGNPAEYEQPRIQNTNGGCIHKLGDSGVLPACGVRLQVSEWTLVEGADLSEDEADHCEHQDCYADDLRVQRP